MLIQQPMAQTHLNLAGRAAEMGQTQAVCRHAGRLSVLIEDLLLHTGDDVLDELARFGTTQLGRYGVTALVKTSATTASPCTGC